MKTFSKALFTIALMAIAVVFSQPIMAQSATTTSLQKATPQRVSTDKVYKVNAAGEVQTIEKNTIEKKACTGQKKACCASKKGSAGSANAGGEKKACCASKGEAGKTCTKKKRSTSSAMMRNGTNVRDMKVEPVEKAATLSPSGN